jgi:hypothetical protein
VQAPEQLFQMTRCQLCTDGKNRHEHPPRIYNSNQDKYNGMIQIQKCKTKSIEIVEWIDEKDKCNKDCYSFLVTRDSV